MSRTRDEIEQDIKRVSLELSTLNGELRKFQIDHCGVSVGEVVIANAAGLVRSEAIVREIDARWNPPWLVVSFRKRDGSWSNRKCNAYSQWEKPKEKPK